jgi:nucleotide-binding universal stress UspA family protein
MQLKSILCPIDFSDFSVAAYQYSLSLAEYYKARLVALHVVELWKYPFADYAAHEADYAKFCNAMDEGGAVQLRRFVEQYPAGAIQPELVIHRGSASNCILAVAQEENLDVIVMGTHGRRGFDRLVLGSATDRVIRKAACPVLVVSDSSHKALCTGPDGRHCLKRIVYCTDFSNNSEQARGYAISLASEYGAELTLMHVVEKASDAAGQEQILSKRRQALDKIVSEVESSNLKVKPEVRFGKPYEEIVRHATEAQASIIIMTARGGDAVDRAVFGSTTYRVIQLGPCPVLAIHT